MDRSVFTDQRIGIFRVFEQVWLITSAQWLEISMSSLPGNPIQSHHFAERGSAGQSPST